MELKELKFYKLFKPIAEDNRLTPTAKLTAMYIYTLRSFDKDCFASNTQIAKKIGVSSSAVDSAIRDLIYYGYINDSRQSDSSGIIEVNCSTICKATFYKVFNVVLKSDLKMSSKFLLSYALSYHNSGKICYASNSNIKKHIGLGKSAVGENAIPELVSKGLGEVSNGKGKNRAILIPKDSDPLKQLKSEIEIQDDTDLKVPDSPLKTVSSLPENSRVFPETNHSFIENRNSFPESSNNKRSNYKIKKKPFNKINKDLIDTNNNLDTKLFELMRNYINTLENEKNIEDEDINNHILTLTLEEKISMFNKLQSPCDEDSKKSYSIKKELQSKKENTITSTSSEPESNSSTKKEDLKFNKEQTLTRKPIDSISKVESHVTTSTEIKPSGLTFEDLVNQHLQHKIKSPSAAVKVLNDNNISPSQLISQDNITLLFGMEDLSDFINKENRIVIYFNENEVQRDFFLYGKTSSKFKMLSKPPLGFDPRLFCIYDFQSKKPIPNAKDYISEDDIDFLISIKGKKEIDYSEQSLKRFMAVMKLNKFPNNFQYYSILFDENLIANESDDEQPDVSGNDELSPIRAM